ncbi:MAG: DUF1622 domain-containing protein [Bacteroidia bacterium]|nr:DUF1622 domain-containing protein [Bacteroidia bacterium]
MEWIKHAFLLIAEVIDLIGIAILIVGFGKLLIKYVRLEFSSHIFKLPLLGLQKIRCELGIYILLALDFLISSDIIRTILDISSEQLIALTAMVVLRTGIGYFLGNEIAQIHEEA